MAQKAHHRKTADVTRDFRTHLINHRLLKMYKKGEELQQGP